MVELIKKVKYSHIFLIEIERYCTYVRERSSSKGKSRKFRRSEIFSNIHLLLEKIAKELEKNKYKFKKNNFGILILFFGGGAFNLTNYYLIIAAIKLEIEQKKLKMEEFCLII